MDIYEFLAELETQITPLPSPAHIQTYALPNDIPAFSPLFYFSDIPPSPPPDDDTPPLAFPSESVTPRTYLELIHRLAHDDPYPGQHAPPLCRPGVTADQYEWRMWDEGKRERREKRKSKGKAEEKWVKVVKEGVRMGWMV